MQRIQQSIRMSNIVELYTCIQTEGSQAGRPNILVRTTGCTHRCYFGEGGWCDSWYTSIHPEKGKFTIKDVERMIEDNPHITNLMLTGGAPTMHPQLMEQVMELADQYGLFVTLETEGSHFVATRRPIDLISLSPKFSNSVPQLAVVLPGREGDAIKTTDQALINQHNKFRLNYGAMRQMIEYHKDYHFKPVIDRSTPIWDEIEECMRQLEIPKEKVWVMPAGSTREEVIPNYSYVIEQCIARGYNFTGRAHIIAFDDKRGV